MRLPGQRYVLPNGLRWDPENVPYQSWHYHVMKHPLGVHRMRNAAGYPVPWDREEWTRLAPPVLTHDERPRVMKKIALVQIGGQQCGVQEVFGKPPPKRPSDRFPCNDCAAPVAEECRSVLHDQHAVGRRYAEVTEDLVSVLRDGVPVGRSAWLERFARLVRTNPESAASALVLTVGLPALENRLRVRISRGDGVRAEFWLYPRGVMQWRTTYREPPTPNRSISKFLCEFLPSCGFKLSEECLVARLWWEQHAS